ncbi:BGTF surface domain-containing protein [Halobaculum magnesiiphilum]|uniref:DUF7827 domain-containing protein n=1 Tax=Halobaculum magnesiiphilum TaxID=1017351 RepID=A0A8T8WAK8_9EURY|nr:BGTF surface domain-containing protein [Halobaculum magnesiiphilum]QZP36793.1 hypothetical protein K6T50_10820 [Halobaculum magnesiiphilum]
MSTHTDSPHRPTTLVQSDGDSEVNLSEGSIEVPRGGIATFTVRLNDSGSSATVVIGNESEDGYQANVSVTDANDDGEVTFAFNTYTAGNTSAGTVVRLVGDSESDRITFDSTESQTGLNSLLDTGDYLVAVGTNDDPAAVLETPDFVGALFVAERSDPSQTLWRTTQDTLSDVREASDNETRSAVTSVGDAIVNERLTRTDTLAFTPNDSNSDVLVTELSVPGLSGMLGTVSGGEVTDEFTAAIRSNNSSDAPFRVVLAEQNPGLNREPVTLDLGETLSAGTGIDDALTVVYAGGDTFYVFVDYDAVAASTVDGTDSAFEDGDEIAVNGTLQDARLLDIDPNETDASEGASRYPTASATFTLEAADGEFDVNEDDLVTTTAGENATITGTTNVAPGTELTVVIRSGEEVQAAFLESQTVTVGSDGTFTASFNLSAQAPGDTFEAEVTQGPFTTASEGVIVEENATEAS